ncbi:MAG TPA: prolyl oligopeptidase family serine peptidase [Candidatus Limnocylindrales bacterium]|nr:prolyl oligopeptidase family serine peptidase [Candidatus Limnocylindrales bacterium]
MNDLMTKKVSAPFGAWDSPFPIELLTRGAVSLGEIHADGGVRYWLEGRPEEGGRQVLVRLDPDGSMTRLTPEGFNVRTRVHEYGGGAFAVGGDRIVVSDFATGRLHRVVAPERLEALTPDGRIWRFADLSIDAERNRVLAVREDHDPETLRRHGEAENAIVAIDLMSGEVTVLADGSDFLAAPRLSPNGRQLAWLRWNHPNMPWDGTELVLADLDDAGRPTAPRVVAGSMEDWIAQPRWSPDGTLHFIAEPEGWLNLFRLAGGQRVERVGPPLDAEFAFPDWVFAIANYAFAADGSIVAIGRNGGRDRLYRFGAGDDRPTELDAEFTEMGYLAIDGRTAVMRAASPNRAWAIVELDLDGGTPRVLRASTTAELDPADISTGRLVEFPTTGGRTAFALYYEPLNRGFEGPAGTQPPLIVTSHGGPTAGASSALNVGLQLFTSRGFAVLDVDYGGSTGYGRDYRKRLEGEWGVVDVDDCVNGAAWLVERGLVDGERLAIRGGSASGYTTLCAITFRDTFKAGTSYFGIGDLETFDTQTHKFESRYTGSLVGPYPAAKQLYHDRSPLNFTERISCPVLILQGAEDRIVPPAQAAQIVDALWEKHLPHAYLLFEGEDHGFRAAENIIRSFEAELSFYGQVFGFEPADAIEPVEVQFLESTTAPIGSRDTA